MGNELFGEDIAKIVYDNMKGQLLDATLTKVTPGTRTPGNLTEGTNPTETPKTAEGFIDSQNRRNVGGALVKDGDIIIVLIGNSIEDLTIPAVNDKVTIEGSTYRVKAVDRDPAAATYALLARSE